MEIPIPGDTPLQVQLSNGLLVYDTETKKRWIISKPTPQQNREFDALMEQIYKDTKK
jgi:hypothetical protein